MLLEEIILKALNTAGYDTVVDADGDLVHRCAAGLEIDGRGTRHQIDAIADYFFQQPFSHPQRLLVEAKCYRTGVGLEVIRNAVGVFKDLAEFWNSNHVGQQRFHYQYAVFSATHFSPQAEAYAFAQDIYLFPLWNSWFFRPILLAIWHAKTRQLDARRRRHGVSLRNMRLAFRKALQDPRVGLEELEEFLAELQCPGAFDQILQAASSLRGLLFASTMSGFLVLLVPSPDGPTLEQLIALATQERIRIRVQRRQSSRTWFIESAAGEKLFTLDIPPELFRLYTREGSLDRQARMNIKTQEFGVFQAPYRIEGETGLARFRLDQAWLHQIEEGLG